jgi:DNA polymerase (family 10)
VPETAPDRREVAAVLAEMAVLLELSGANPFRQRAVARAARAIEALEEDLAGLVAEDRLREIPGIGKGLASDITELVTTGRLTAHESLLAEVPPGLFDVLRLPGLGPKKARLLHEKLGITGLDDLEAAARGERLRELPGFGAKTCEKILAGIDHVRRVAGHVLLPEAQAVAAELEARVRALPGVSRVGVAGAVRRWRETVTDVELVAAVAEESGPEILAAFAELAADADLPVTLHAVPESDFAAALYCLTGSDGHLAELAPRLAAHDLELTPQGLRRAGEPVAVADEAELLAELGLPLLPPEVREGRGEVAAAAAGELPTLVTAADLRGTLHVHTPYSDGHDSLTDLVAATRERGWSWLGISDHSQTASYANGLEPERVRDQWEEIDLVQGANPDVRLLKGIESDILADGSLDYDDELLAGFDFVIASVHSRFGLPEEQMTERILTALRHPAVGLLGHATGRLLLSREPYAVDLDRVLAEAGRLGVAVELNGNAQRLDLDWRRLRQATACGVTICIAPDAHDAAGLDDTLLGLGIARKGWLGPADLLNSRDADEVLDFFRRRREGWRPGPGRSRHDADGTVLP